LLGYFWAFIPPLFTTMIWVFLNSQNILDVGDPGMPYPLFVLTGTVLWQTFADALDSPLKVVSESKPMLAKINFPREALILTSFGLVLFNFVIRLVLLVAVFAWYKISPPTSILLVPIGVFALILLGMMIGLLLTPFGILYHDIGRAIAIGTQAWFFLTPVIYPPPQSSWAATLVNLNPVTPLLQTTREWLITGETTLLPGFFWVTGISLIMLFAGWVIFRIAMPHLIARMSA
jgi:lipopolysaccharide transport system permease protein